MLEDLLVAVRLPVFSRRARRDLTTHPKFFYFDLGVYRAIRPRGPLDSADEIDGTALETLLFQKVRAHNDAHDLGYEFSHWRTRAGYEVDLVLYGERGLHAFAVKRAARLREEDFGACARSGRSTRPRRRGSRTGASARTRTTGAGGTDRQPDRQVARDRGGVRGDPPRRDRGLARAGLLGLCPR